ncbi:MAG: formate acetyltransferase [Candidatus Eremiobacteraeota bacterium]|nr:formate acetyltransferase [Candidatus Eremiobacteraeota bacterium]
MKTKLSAKKEMYELLQSVAQTFNSTPSLQEELKGTQGWINATVGIRTGDNQVQQAVIIKDGKISVIQDSIPKDAGATLVFATEKDLADYQKANVDDVCRMILASRIRVDGNQALYGYFNYLVSLLFGQDDIKAAKSQAEEHQKENLKLAEKAGKPDRQIRNERIAGRLKGKKVDPGVGWLDDPYMAKYSLDDFPRLKQFKDDHHNTLPEVSAEQGKLLTDFHIEHGYETKKDGTPWDPNLRMAKAFHYLMANREPVIRPNGLIAGTMTPNPICGSVTQPYTIGWSIWGELKTIHGRELDPYNITNETIETLHKHVFPFWMNRNIHQLWIDKFDYPFPAQINDRLFCLNLWSLVSLHPGCPGFEKAVKMGIKGIREEIDRELNSDPKADPEKKNTLEAMKISLDAVSVYAKNLAQQAGKEAKMETDPRRRKELEHIHDILLRVPDNPAQTLEEAVQTLWIMFIAIGLEGMDDDVAFGRMDQILQPYFEADIKKKSSQKDKEDYIKYALEVVGCLFMRITSHRIGAPTIASWQNSGAPPTSTTIVGGVTPDGKDAVNDMSYIVLKAAEILSLNDPNMHARFMPGVNSETYLKRLCEVNYITCGTPGIHNDEAVIKALSQNDGWAIEDIRDWTPTGCVEPVLPGKHLACTGDIDSNLMAPFTMALNNGYHPVAMWDFGPKTGKIEDFKTFEEFYNAFKAQFEFIYGQAFIGSLQLLKIHQQVMPSPLYSAITEGCIEKGRGITRGGAKYNSSGASLIALSDVIDSLMVIKKLVFDEEKFSFKELKEAIDNNFEGYSKIHALTATAAPKFGSGDQETVDMANRVTRMVADLLHNQDNGRGGNYSTGYRSNNNHTVYGRVSGASPSGRLAGSPFTPGLTPNPSASKNILDNLLDVAKLDPETLDNNIAFNVRLSFSKKNTYEQNIDNVADIVNAYFDHGGMQIQFIMVDADTLKDAMAHPEYYRDVVVRVSGYTGYYVQMQRDLQLEILGRSEFGV